MCLCLVSREAKKIVSASWKLAEGKRERYSKVLLERKTNLWRDGGASIWKYQVSGCKDGEVSKWRHLNLGLNSNFGWYRTLDLLRSFIPVTTGGFELQTSSMQLQIPNLLIHKAAAGYKRLTGEILPWSHGFAILVNFQYDIKYRYLQPGNLDMTRELSQCNNN